MDNFRIIAAIVLISAGAIFSILACIGVFRFRFVLNRMHAAALGDTCGLMFCLLGICLLTGLSFTTLKILLIIVFFWFASPVSGHFMSNLIFHTMSQETFENAEVKDLKDIK